MIENELNFSQPPLQKWEDPVFTLKKLQVAVLRLDKMHLQLGGNKWMKLRGFLQQAISEGKLGILTKGGPWSNHVHAAAWACRQLGLSFSVWIKGHAGLQTQMLTDVQKWDATIRFVNRSLFYDEANAISFAEENNLLYVPMGGADERGVTESSRFLQSLNLTQYDYAACAVGTATTFGGLAFVPDNFLKIIGIDAGTNDASVIKQIAEWQQELLSKTLLLNQDYSFGGFARFTPELIRFANDLYRQTGIPTDIVYTAKLFYGVLHLAKEGFFPIGSSVMLLHSGGLQGNRSLPIGTLQF